MSWIRTSMKPVKLCIENPYFPLSSIFQDIPWELSGGTKQACLLASSLILANNIDRVIEIGCWHGFSSLILAKTLCCNSKNPFLLTVDINPRALIRSINLIGDLPVEYITVEKDSLEIDLKPYVDNVGLAFIDGNHQYEYCINDLKKCDEVLNTWGFFVVHDYSKTGYPGVYSAVKEFISEKQYPMFYFDENRESTDYRTCIIQKSGEY